MVPIENNPVIKKILQDFVSQSAKAFRDAVRREGLLDTEDLLNSIREGAVEVGSGFITGHVYYSELLRVKDLKELRYTTIPPIGPLAEWVEGKGLNRFPYVPGMENGIKKSSEIQGIYRVARGIQYHLKAVPNVKRGYRGIYNEPLKLLIATFYENMREYVATYTANAFKEAFGYEIHISISESENVNTARIQAAWNARDTKLARKYEAAGLKSSTDKHGNFIIVKK